MRHMGMTVALAAILVSTACVTNPETGNKRISKAVLGGVLGAAGGYLLGDIIGGKRDRTEKLLGAGIGAVAGAGIGYYMDEQEKKLRERTANTGIELERRGDELLVNLPDNVSFGYDSAAIKPQFESALNRVAETLTEYPNSYIDIYGHTDSTGSEDYNLRLSERRASSVTNYLVYRGVDSVRLATRGFGESQLKCRPEVTPSDYQCNRRVELRITPVTQSDVAAVR